MTWKQRISEIRKQYGDKVAQAKGIMESIKNNTLEDSERSQCDQLLNDAEALIKGDEFKKLLEIEERSKKIDAAMQDDPDDDNDGGDRRRHDGRKTRSAQPNQGGRVPSGTRGRRQEVDEERYQEALGTLFRHGPQALDDEQRGVLRFNFSDGSPAGEERATATSVGVADGAALVSPQMAANITEALTVFSGLREMGAEIVTTTSGSTMEFPGVDYSSKIAYEVGEGVEDSTEDTNAFTSKSIPTYEAITPLMYISRTLLQDSSYDVVGVINRTIASSFDALLAKRTVYGDGVNKIRGLLTELCANGDVVDTATSGTFVDADFATLQAALGDFYKFNPACKFGFSPEFCANRFFKLAGSDGHYLYRQAMNKPGQGINGQMWTLMTAMGDTATLPNTPAAAACTLGAAGSASTITAGRIVAIFGDASLYVIRNVQETLVERFTEETGAVRRRAVAFRGVRRIGGGFTSAHASATTRPMAALRIKN